MNENLEKLVTPLVEAILKNDKEKCSEQIKLYDQTISSMKLNHEFLTKMLSEAEIATQILVKFIKKQEELSTVDSEAAEKEEAVDSAVENTDTAKKEEAVPEKIMEEIKES